ncbi:peptidase [Streptomyces solincola]|uniref:Peptidase n=1 Tax=Streptomyces solincola TaxID=2100817 RepID=A0A2S9Q181_9ACTN|nr:alpha/beta hydrolase [Streptomyces solincola]PRH80408.1 peptidase [Streptomyces solincola]
MFSTRVRAAALAATALLAAQAATGCQSGADDGGGGARERGAAPALPGLPAALAGQRPDWRACEAPGAEWRCAEVRVPLDYGRPDGGTIPVALIRKEAGDQDRRIGSLLFDFGGPGASGVDLLPQFAPDYTALNTRYDLVGFDPRGVGRSAGVACRDAAQEADAERRVDRTPDTPAEQAAYLADSRAFGAGCEQRAGKLLPHLTTTNTARDMELLRSVLGDDRLNYFGISYGTQLGAAYAHLFPRHVGRTVLDAVVDPTADTVGQARHQTTGFQRALDNYFDSTGEGAEAGSAALAKQLRRLDGSPLPTADGRPLTESLALTGIAQALYAESLWPMLTEGLRQAREGSGDGLLELADMYNDRREDGSYSTQAHSQRAISCADSSSRPTAAEARALLPEFRRISPVFGEFMAWDTAGWCHDWPVKGESATSEASAPGAGPVLVVGTTGDSATPYEGAVRMAKELGEKVGVLLTYRGEGHGAYNGGSSCVSKAVDAYLLDGRVPAGGTVCT